MTNQKWKCLNSCLIVLSFPKLSIFFANDCHNNKTFGLEWGRYFERQGFWTYSGFCCELISMVYLYKETTNNLNTITVDFVVSTDSKTKGCAKSLSLVYSEKFDSVVAAAIFLSLNLGSNSCDWICDKSLQNKWFGDGVIWVELGGNRALSASNWKSTIHTFLIKKHTCTTSESTCLCTKVVQFLLQDNSSKSLNKK